MSKKGMGRGPDLVYGRQEEDFPDEYTSAKI